MPKRVKVRIAVAVDPTGQWQASGYSNADKWTEHDYILDCLETGEARYWIEAEVDVPEPTVIEVDGEALPAVDADMLAALRAEQAAVEADHELDFLESLQVPDAKRAAQALRRKADRLRAIALAKAGGESDAE